MRFSEAIRLGAMSTKQVVGTLGVAGHSACAIGAALLAQYGEQRFRQYTEQSYMRVHAGIDVNRAWPWANYHTPAAEMPCGCGEGDNITGTVMHLNDVHVWSRDRIADWVEQQERARGLWDDDPVEETQGVLVGVLA